MTSDDLIAAILVVLVVLAIGGGLCLVGNARGYAAAECAQACAGHDEYRLLAGKCTCADRSEAVPAADPAALQRRLDEARRLAEAALDGEGASDGE